MKPGFVQQQEDPTLLPKQRNDCTALYAIPPEKRPLESMLTVSQLVYQYVELRKIVKEHEFTMNGNRERSEKEKEKIPIVNFTTPAWVVTENADKKAQVFSKAKLRHVVTADAILQFITDKKNRGYLKVDKDGVGYDGFDKSGENNDQTPLMVKLLTGLRGNFDADIIEYDDFKVDNGFLKSELLYTVIVNRTDKRIIVCFRGSVLNLKDWFVDFFLTKTRVQSEFEEISGKGIRIHSGFYGFLCRKNKDRENKSKFNEICELLEQVYKYKDKDSNRDYSDYSLFVTGHSLGGALAQLFAFMVASTKQTFLPKNKPVTAVTYASPAVGNHEYQKYFNELESSKELRHLRVTNEGDIVAYGFNILPLGYRQPGVNIHLSEGKKADVAYNRIKKSLRFAFANHMLPVFRDRLPEDIVEKDLEDFYKDLGLDD